MKVRYECMCIAEFKNKDDESLVCETHGHIVYQYPSLTEPEYRIVAHKAADHQLLYALHRVIYDMDGFVVMISRLPITRMYQSHDVGKGMIDELKNELKFAANDLKESFNDFLFYEKHERF